MSGINIIHANSNVLVRSGLRALLGRGGGINRIVDTENSPALFEKLEEEQPDLVIIDYDQGEHFSDTDIVKIRTEYPSIRILIISTERDHSRILKILESGVHGYLTRECDEDEIIQAVFAIGNSEKFYCNKVINIILDKNLKPDEEEDCEPTSLSEREIEITTLIAKGCTSKDIADQLFISPHTVITHRKNIMKKLGINSTSALVLYAVNAGLVTTET